MGGQFHQHSSSSFYAHRSQKRKKTDNLNAFFVLLGSSNVKATVRMLMKLTRGHVILKVGPSGI